MCGVEAVQIRKLPSVSICMHVCNAMDSLKSNLSSKYKIIITAREKKCRRGRSISMYRKTSDRFILNIFGQNERTVKVQALAVFLIIR